MTAPTAATVTLLAHHAGQQIVRDALMTCDGVMMRSGRRFGKTVFGEDIARQVAVGAILPRLANGTPHMGCVGWFSPNSDYALPVWESIKRGLEPITKRVSEQDRAIWLHGSPYDEPNFEVWTCHNNRHPGRSRDYDLAVFDEAGLIDELDTIWAEAVEPTLAIRRGKTVMMGTPLGRRTPFNTRFERVQQGLIPRWQAFQRPSTDNPLVSRAAVDEKERQATTDGPRAYAQFRQEYYGEPMDDGSNPIGLAHIAKAVAPRSSNPVVCWGIDLAMSVDWTVVIGLDAYGRWAFCERWQDDWPITRAKIRRILSGDLCPVADGAMAYVDKTGVGSPIVQDLQNTHDHVIGKTFTAAYRRGIIQRLVVGLPQQRFTLPDGWLRHELESLTAEERSTGVQYDVPTGLHDDGIMALALAAHAFDAVETPMHARTVTQFDVDNRSTVRTRTRPEPTVREWQTTMPAWGSASWGAPSTEDVEL